MIGCDRLDFLEGILSGSGRWVKGGARLNFSGIGDREWQPDLVEEAHTSRGGRSQDYFESCAHLIISVLNILKVLIVLN
jgi:hypothetical protein